MYTVLISLSQAEPKTRLTTTLARVSSFPDYCARHPALSVFAGDHPLYETGSSSSNNNHHNDEGKKEEDRCIESTC